MNWQGERRLWLTYFIADFATGHARGVGGYLRTERRRLKSTQGSAPNRTQVWCLIGSVSNMSRIR